GEKAVGELLDRHRSSRRRRDLGLGRGETRGGRLDVEREGETVGENAAERDVAIRDRERAAAPIARRTRRRARRLRTDGEADAVQPPNAAAAGGDGIDRQHRGEDTNRAAGLWIGELHLVAALQPAIEAADVRARAAHIEAEHRAYPEWFIREVR